MQPVAAAVRPLSMADVAARAGVPVIEASVPGFFAASDGHLHTVITAIETFIDRLYEAGITGGCLTSPLQYCPEGTVTRAQMAIFLPVFLQEGGRPAARLEDDAGDARGADPGPDAGPAAPAAGDDLVQPGRPGGDRGPAAGAAAAGG